MIRIFIFVLLCFIGCATHTENTRQQSMHGFVQKPNIQWTHTKAQILNDTQKAQKVNLLGKCYYLEDGEVCTKILATFEKECDAGIGLSCGMLAIASHDARGVSRDPQKTLLYVRHGCYFDDKLSCMYMRQYYIRANKTKEADRILKAVTKQCTQGGVFECLLLSLVYENDEAFAEQKAHIIPYRKMACDKDFAIACAYLDSKELDKKTYEHYQEQACNLGMLAACDAKRESVDLNARTQHARLYRIW